MRPLHWIALIALVLLWGSSYAVIDAALESGWSPTAANAVRYGIGALVLGAWVTATQGAAWWREVTRRPGRVLAVSASGSLLAGTALLYGQQHVSSGLTGTIIASMAIWTIVIQHTFFDHRHTRGEYIGLGVGLFGVAILYLPTITGDDLALHGIVLVTLAAIGYALGAIFTKRLYTDGEGPALITASTCLYTALLSGGMSVGTGDWHTGSWWMIIVLGLGAISGALFLYYWLIQEVGPAKTMLNAYLVPLLTLSIAAVQGEHLDWTVFAGGAMILVAVVITTWDDLFPSPATKAAKVEQVAAANATASRGGSPQPAIHPAR